MSPKKLPRAVSRVGKAERGPTDVETTPIEIRGIAADGRVAEDMRERTTRAIGHWATLIERIEIRIADVNGPKGGIDTRCAMHVTLAGLPPVHVEDTSSGAAKAFALVLPRVERALRRQLGKAGRRAGRTSRADERSPRLAPADSLLGRREGRGELARAMVLARPGKQQRDLFVDTSLPGVTETDRKAGGGHTARRNTRGTTEGMTVILEDSLAEPSRKSTRRSANRGKPSIGKERSAVMKSITPRARRSRGRTPR